MAESVFSGLYDEAHLTFPYFGVIIQNYELGTFGRINGLFHILFYYIYVKEQQELWRGDEAGLEANYDSRTEWVLRKLYTTQTAVKLLVAPSCNGDAVIKTKACLAGDIKEIA